MVARLPLLDHVLSLQVGALVHALHHVLDLLQLQPLQVLVLVQAVRQELLHTVRTQTTAEGEGDKASGPRTPPECTGCCLKHSFIQTQSDISQMLKQPVECIWKGKPA